MTWSDTRIPDSSPHHVQTAKQDAEISRLRNELRYWKAKAFDWEEKYLRTREELDRTYSITSTKHPSLETIARLVCRAYGLRHAEIFSDRQGNAYAWPRAHFCFLAREWTPYSYPVIARYVKRDHTSVIHARRRHMERLQKGHDMPAITIKEEHFDQQY